MPRKKFSFGKDSKKIKIIITLVVLGTVVLGLILVLFKMTKTPTPKNTQSSSNDTIIPVTAASLTSSVTAGSVTPPPVTPPPVPASGFSGKYNLQNVQAKQRNSTFQMLSTYGNLGYVGSDVVLYGGAPFPPTSEWIITPSTITPGAYSLQNVQAKQRNSAFQMLSTYGGVNVQNVVLYSNHDFGITCEWYIIRS